MRPWGGGLWLACLLAGAASAAGSDFPAPPSVYGESGPPSAPPLPAVTPRVVSHGDRSLRQIALTFDACSTEKPSGYDPRIVEVLHRTRTPATFFLGGRWMQEHPEVTRELASVPFFELGNHTMLHPHLTREPDERVRRELRETQGVLFALTGRQGTLFRPPYGEYDRRVVRLAARLGLTTVAYDLPSGDPDPRFDGDRLVKHVTRNAKGGSIVVLHVNGRGWHTAEALPEIIARLRAKGFELCTVGALAGEAQGHRRRPDRSGGTDRQGAPASRPRARRGAARPGERMPAAAGARGGVIGHLRRSSADAGPVKGTYSRSYFFIR